jgi:lipid II isoglutaminyl synthase (glutamine-hydrolysing)
MRDAERRGLLGQARAASAVIAGRAAGATARRLRLGAGTSLPGLVAGRIDPGIISYLGRQLRHGSLVVTGTNGKTTTCGLLAYTLRDAGMRVWRNREGANLLRGVAAALVIRAQPHGRLRWHGNAAAVFEVDEAAFPAVVAEARPRVMLVTNLFRDQLDRYGEVDTVIERWRAALAGLTASSTLVLNADDPAVASLGDTFAGRVLHYGVADVRPAASAAGASALPTDEVIDTRTCPRCHAPLAYTRRFYSHIGHWRCPACGNARPTPAIEARTVTAGLDGSAFTLTDGASAVEVALPLPGLYNVYNAVAAYAAASVAGADVAAARSALGRFAPAFGRGERVAVEGRVVRILLAKNPTGLNEVLRTLATAPESANGAHLLLALNDQPADGEDVSWIWDANFVALATLARSAVVSGTRAYDLALRLKYAGIPIAATAAAATPEPARYTIQPDIAAALDAALAQTGAGETLSIVPTYTAMLAVRAELERRGYAAHYWETVDA